MEITIRKPKTDYGTIIFEVFKEVALPVLRENLKEYADLTAQRLKDRIRSNSFNFKAERNPTEGHLKYTKIKERLGQSTPLIFTGQYVDSISVLPLYDDEDTSGEPTSYVVGFRDEEHEATFRSVESKLKTKFQKQIAKGQLRWTEALRKKLEKTQPALFKSMHTKATSVKMVDLARWLEFGTSKIPARPHWRPVLLQIRKEHNLLKRQITKEMNAEVKSALKQYFDQTVEQKKTV